MQHGPRPKTANVVAPGQLREDIPPVSEVQNGGIFAKDHLMQKHPELADEGDDIKLGFSFDLVVS